MPIRRSSQRLRGLAIAAWLAVVGTGFGFAWRYEGTPGRSAGSKALAGGWPVGSALPRDAARPTVVQFVHPECPCSRVGLDEIAELAQWRRNGARIVVVLVGAPGLEASLENSANGRAAREVPGATIVSDPQGVEARRFGAATSGQTFVFSPNGAPLFQGGVTVARGHYGRNAGLSAVASALSGEPVGVHVAPVYGCPLRSEAP